MKTNYYFFRATYGTKAKNKLHQEFEKYLLSLNGAIIPADKYNDFTFKIIEEKNRLNKHFSRCLPIELRFSTVANKVIAVFGTNTDAFFYPAYMYQV